MSGHDLRSERGLLVSAFLGLLIFAIGIAIVAMGIWWLP